MNLRAFSRKERLFQGESAFALTLFRYVEQAHPLYEIF